MARGLFFPNLLVVATFESEKWPAWAEALFQHASKNSLMELQVELLVRFSGRISCRRMKAMLLPVEFFRGVEVSLICFRSDNLMNVTSPAAAEAIMADLSTVKVIPVLQVLLATNGERSK